MPIITKKSHPEFFEKVVSQKFDHEIVLKKRKKDSTFYGYIIIHVNEDETIKTLPNWEQYVGHWISDYEILNFEYIDLKEITTLHKAHKIPLVQQVWEVILTNS